jgi:hypothetical protein
MNFKKIDRDGPSFSIRVFIISILAPYFLFICLFNLPFQLLFISFMSSPTTQLPEIISNSILLIRDQKVMLDAELAKLYGVPTKRLNEQVKRNIERFPEDFMFQLSENEWQNLKSQFATSSFVETEWGGRRTLPYVFTEQGISMLSSVLSSPTAIQVNIAIMRVFVNIRNWALNYKDLTDQIHEINQHQFEQDLQIQQIYETIDSLIKPSLSERKQIGFRRES